MPGIVHDRRGSIAIMFALVATIVVGLGGMALDFGRAESVRKSLQETLDAAVLAAAVRYSESEADVAETGRNYVASRDIGNGASLAASNFVMQGNRVVGTAAASVPTSISRMVGWGESLTVNAVAEVGLQSNFSDFHLIIDVSESMNIAASPAEIARMEALTRPLLEPITGEPGCTFGCHVRETDFEPQGRTMYQFAKDNGITLRADVVRDASISLSRQLLSETTLRQWRIGVAHFSDTFDVRLAPSSDLGEIEDAIATSPLVPASTSLNMLESAVENFVGTSGDGRTAGTPKKFVVLATDGAMNGREPKAPLNVDVCDNLKAQGVTIAVIYAPQMSPGAGTWAYDTWVVPILPQLEANLRTCASSPAYFFEAQRPDEIVSAFKQVGERLLASSIALAR